MTSKQITWRKLVTKLLDAVATWKIHVGNVQSAMVKKDKVLRSKFMKAMFFWRKKAEELAQLEKSLRLEIKCV